MSPIYFDNKRHVWYCGRQAIRDGDAVKFRLSVGIDHVLEGVFEESEFEGGRWWLRCEAPSDEKHDSVTISIVPRDGLLVEMEET